MLYKQSDKELKQHLKEQIEFLRRSSNSYDLGYKSESKRLAVVIRVLVHDTSSSTSLLTLLGKKDMLFYDTALDYNQNNLAPTMGLIITRLRPNRAEYIPPLDDGVPSRYKKGKVPFYDWWNKIVLVDKYKNKFTRKQLVLAVSNKDGGVHVDPKLNKAYSELTRKHSLGWVFIKNGEKTPITGCELASIRQISHEILKSFHDEFLEFF